MDTNEMSKDTIARIKADAKRFEILKAKKVAQIAKIRPETKPLHHPKPSSPLHFHKG